MTIQLEIQLEFFCCITMQKKMKEAGLPEPVFTNERKDFVVTFYNGEYPELYPEEYSGPAV